MLSCLCRLQDDSDKDTEDADTEEVTDADDEADDSDEDASSDGPDMDTVDASEDTVDASEDAEELGKEFDGEEQEREDILRREKKTLAKVAQAADSARAEARKEAAAADHLEALQRHMESLSPVN